MAYREVTMIEVKEVLRQWLSGHSLVSSGSGEQMFRLGAFP